MEWTPNNCPHLWGNESITPGVKRYACILCGVRKFELETVSPGRKRIRRASSNAKSVSMKLSSKAFGRLRELATENGMTRSQVVEHLLMVQAGRRRARVSPGEGQMAHAVYVLEKLVFKEWEPLDCSCVKDEMLESLADEGDDDLRVVEYMPLKPVKHLLATLEACLSSAASPETLVKLRAAAGQIKGMLKKRVDV